VAEVEPQQPEVELTPEQVQPPEAAGGSRLLWGLPGLALGCYLVVFGPLGIPVLILTVATVLPRRLKSWLAYLLVVLGMLTAMLCFMAWGVADVRSWLTLWVPALVLIRVSQQKADAPAGRRVFWTAAALLAVVALAMVAGGVAYRHFATPAKGEFVQRSVSPSGRWELTTYFLNNVGLGPDSGVLRVDVRDLAEPSSQRQTAYVDSAENSDMVKRTIRWLDGEHVSISEERSGTFEVDVAHDRTAPPSEFMSGIAGALAALAAFGGVLIVGLLAILVVVPMLMARQAVQALPEGRV
jgi:hypothetical protein